MSAPKKWIGLAAIGAAIAALFSGLRHREGHSVTPPNQAKPVDAT